MTIGALLLGRKFYRHGPPPGLAYATLGLLFVSISIGGTLTNFAAPPVLMVASVWKWSSLFMLTHFGWKAVTAIVLSTAVYFLVFRKHLRRLDAQAAARGPLSPDPSGGDINDRDYPIPAWVTAIHLGFLAWTVYAAHFPVLFMGGFLFFTAFVIATRHHQTEIQLRGPVLVGFFLAGLIIHGGCQAWWIEPVIKLLSDDALMVGAAVLTAFNDNAAITYLAAQVQDIGNAAKYAVVAGAVLGGGLTVIANAPNPTGQSLLSKFFKFGISPARLLAGALLPTIIAYLCFALLPVRPPHEGPRSAAPPPPAATPHVDH
jgi:Na+/H+ antiporter NhaD/arsenite permease-like protein